MPRGRKKKPDILSMSEEEQELLMADIITKDIMKFIEVVVRKRVSLFVKEIRKGVKNDNT